MTGTWNDLISVSPAALIEALGRLSKNGAPKRKWTGVEIDQARAGDAWRIATDLLDQERPAIEARPHLLLSSGEGPDEGQGANLAWFGWPVAAGGIFRIRIVQADTDEQSLDLAASAIANALAKRFGLPAERAPHRATVKDLRRALGKNLPAAARNDLDMRVRALLDPPKPAPATAPAAAGAAAPSPARGARARGTRAAFAGTPDQLRALDRHIVNLRQGRLSDSGIATTTELELDALVEAVARALADGGCKALAFYAHGGLTDERYALSYAWETHGWWLENGIYPIYFIWETGALETFWQIVEAALERRRGATRDLWDRLGNILTDAITDPLVELIAREPGRALWRAMKGSAARAADPIECGGAIFVEKLAARLGTKRPAMHAIGHSAGSIFHAHFLPVLLGQMAGQRIASLSLLAPAITNEAFKRRLLPLAENSIDKIVMFTMDRRHELADDCRNIYRKSLLYLLHHALEEEDHAPILGLMETLSPDPVLSRLFRGDRLVISPNEEVAGRSASRSITHGGFDNDPFTMESVARRIVDGDVTRFPIGARSLTAPRGASQRPLFDLLTADAPQSAPAPAAQAPAPVRITPGAQRFALGIGINAYDPPYELSGCVADARLWAETLALSGFETRLLLDREATADRIKAEMQGALANARTGDALVFHFASHGTQVLDVSNDEPPDAQTGRGLDQAICAVDVDDGGIILDDELRRIYEALPRGVSLVCFSDLCHSGHNWRLAPSLANGKARYMRLETPTELRAAARLRSRGAAVRNLSEDEEMPHIAFSACRRDESAMEMNGHGIFTRAAIDVIARDGLALSASELMNRIALQMGPQAMQHPSVNGAAGRLAARLFSGVR